ncbi:MAG: hypothetical protein KGJ23_07080 [Euryarchaeota archaeon]|nr:hypothetical protein [Euryarchaeota archaeon]MDE1836362.1 hypothetical protein [Euryarchaeota archaeon]MDE1881801.1 hypothetical protein [Euryarchaeota archaeon]MDE2044242.1 hypothetical protein [Thermoplasmata archaeon]
MAKKVKKRVEEDQHVKEFKFPHFDARAFILHELEQSYATAIALSLALLLAVVSWQVTVAGLGSGSTGVLPFALGALAMGVAGAVAMVFLIQKVRPKAEEYKRGDWASLVMTYLFLWAGIWALLVDVWA